MPQDLRKANLPLHAESMSEIMVRVRRQTFAEVEKRKILRELAIKAYHAAATPLEAKMAGILLDLFAPDMAE